MKNFHSYFNGYTEDQFAENEYFRQWVLNEESDNAEFWNNYVQINPHQQQTILRARKKVEASLHQYALQPLTNEEKLILKQTIYQLIGQPLKSYNRLRQKSLQVLKVAAIVSGIILVPVYFLYKQPKAETFIVNRTGGQETKEILLPDSTLVILNANSSISYSSAIRNISNRELILSGNAFFKVKKKVDQRPFTVHANSVSIAVLGTEFNVNARSRATTIVLTTGKVKVSLDGHKAATAYLSPGEKVRLDTLHKTFIKSNTNALLYSAWSEGEWNFSSTSLVEITSLIYEYYGIETVYADEKAKRLKISGVIPVTGLSSFTNILAKTLDLKITENNNQLHIQF